MIVKLGSSALIETSEVIKSAGIPENVKNLLTDKDPDFVYFVARAVTADIPNGNGDLFPWAELQKSYKTFIGQHID